MFRSLSHMVVSAVLLVAVIGPTINLHYCNGQLYDMALNVPAHSCCETGGHQGSCHQDADPGERHHCANESIAVQTSGDFLVTAFSFGFDNDRSCDLFISTRVVRDLHFAQAPPSRDITLYKKPPGLRAVSLSKIQTFLI